MTANSNDQPRRPPTPGSWRPGQSGNPRGRPGKATSLTDAIRRGVDVDELVGIALDLARTATSEGTRIAALGWLRDSGFVKPAERHELALGRLDDEDDRDLDALDAGQLRELLEAEREFELRRAAIMASAGMLPASETTISDDDRSPVANQRLLQSGEINGLAR